MPIFNKFTISNLLVLISLIFTIIGYLYPSFINEWSINNIYLYEGNYFHWIIQFLSGTFIHGGIMHLIMNSIFVYYFGNILEIVIGKTKYMIFFLLFVIFNGVVLSYISTYYSTIGISGFALAILAYYTLDLKSLNNPEYKGGITAIIINIAIGFYPGISLYGHLNGVVFGIIFFYLTNDFFKRQIIGLFKYLKTLPSTEGFNPLNSTKKD